MIQIKEGMKVKHKLINEELIVVADEKGPAYTGNDFKDNEISMSFAKQELKNGVLEIIQDESKEVKEGGTGFEGGDLHGMDEVIEALGYLLSSYRADFKNITGAELNDTHAVKYAKYVLNKYPSPKRGRFSY